MPPIATMFTVTEPIPGCEDFSYFCRPSVGPSSIAFYDADGVPELSGRLLTTTLVIFASTVLVRIGIGIYRTAVYLQQA